MLTTDRLETANPNTPLIHHLTGRPEPPSCFSISLNLAAMTALSVVSGLPEPEWLKQPVAGCSV